MSQNMYIHAHRIGETHLLKIYVKLGVVNSMLLCKYELNPLRADSL